jgi:hypothetical protein
MMVACEQAILAQDNTLSAIRIIDTITLPFAPPKESDGMEISAIRLAIILKKAESHEPCMLKLICVDPSGKRKAIGASQGAMIEGTPEAGNNLVVPLLLTNGGEGLYWIELLANESLIARCPVRIKFGTGKPDEAIKRG